jgi:hypothetical protein
MSNKKELKQRLQNLAYIAEQSSNSYLANQLKSLASEIESNESAKEEREFDSEPLATSSESIIGNRIATADYHEADVDPKGVKTETPIVFDALTEETWQDIFAEWRHKLEHQNGTDVYFTLESYLQSNFNVPTRKQQ